MAGLARFSDVRELQDPCQTVRAREIAKPPAVVPTPVPLMLTSTAGRAMCSGDRTRPRQ